MLAVSDETQLADSESLGSDLEVISWTATTTVTHWDTQKGSKENAFNMIKRAEAKWTPQETWRTQQFVTRWNARSLDAEIYMDVLHAALV